MGKGNDCLYEGYLKNKIAELEGKVAEAGAIERELIRALWDHRLLPLDDYLDSEHLLEWQPLPQGPVERWHNWAKAQAREAEEEL